MAMADYTQELVQKQIRDRLNAEKVRLWLPPYSTEDGQKGDSPQELIQKYSKELNLSEDVVESTIESLRVHALQKLAERNRFQKSGIATLKVKLAGKRQPQETSGSPGNQVLSLEVSLDVSGSELRRLIAEKVGILQQQVKLICSGHVITDQATLVAQNIKNGVQMMCLCLSVSEGEAQQQQEDVMTMRKTREAAELLSERAGNEDENFYIQIADQSGRPLNLPAEEKKALTLAMTLHEKGRVALKRKETAQALLLLLEADKEFRKCRADILNSVDNYAILCLDIVWCYLCLKNVEDLPDADSRLHKSEECFLRSYGSNMERLTAVKGGSGTEVALFVRLHLLQGIVAFHQHKLSDAVRLLSKAEGELQRLNVDEESLLQVMSMGFSEREARLGLRACGGSIEGAVSQIMKKKEEKKEIEKKVKEDRRKKRIAKHLGKTANGDEVNVDSYDMLLSMGFSKGAAAEALRQSNNDISQALEVLQNRPELLNLPDPEPSTVNSVTDEMLAQVTAMGFDPEAARRALAFCSADVQRAIEQLVQSGGIMPPVPVNLTNSVFSTPSTSSGESSTASSPPTKSPEEIQKEKEAIESLVSDIPKDEEDYLDINLQEENQFLNEYKALLASIQHKT